MDNVRLQTKSESLSPRHFRKLHERVMIKYHEMQKKLEKSKSLDYLSTISDSESFKDDQRSINSEFDSDVQEDDVFNNTEFAGRHNVTFEDDIKSHAISNQYHNREIIQVHFEDDFTIIGDSDFEEVNDEILSTAKHSSSTESFPSLHEKNEDNTHKTPSTPVRARKMSIREKIGNRILAAKEKRRESKERKRDSVGNVEKLILTNSIINDVPLKKRNKTGTVTVALVEASGFDSNCVSNDRQRMLYCRMRLGSEKRKSKIVKTNAAVVSWQELFNFNMYDDSQLELILMDKDISIGRAFIDLNELKIEKTHKIKTILDDDAKIRIFLLLTISGTMAETFTETDRYQLTQEHLDAVQKQFEWYKITKNLTDVGWLSVTVYGAKGLAGTENYCILQLGNERLQTHTYYKSQDPIWIKMFSFAVTDVTSILEVIVFDEKKDDEVGRISIRLLQIKNAVRTWYALKDITQRYRAKGNNPRILLEMNLKWNLVKASIRVINPKDEIYMATETKFHRHIFARNWTRAKAVLNWILDAFKVLRTCFEWESRRLNLVALTVWLVFCWVFKPWMVPLLLLIPYFWYRPPKYFLMIWKNYKESNVEVAEINEKSEEKNLTFIQKIHSLQEMIQTVQSLLGKLASLGESVKNLFNFAEPFLSCLAIFFIIAISTIMYIIPFSYILMIWGCHKFIRKIIWPERIPNNEILDLLSRVPDDQILLDCEMLPLQELPEEDNKLVQSAAHKA